MTGAIDSRKVREQLLPASWQPWQKPRPALPIDEWVAQQKFARGILPPHIEQNGCPYWYVRCGVVTAVHMADQQACQWVEKQKDLRFETKPKYIEATLGKYADDATAIAETAKLLHQQISSFWQLHLGIDGNLYRYDHPKVSAIPRNPEIDRAAVLGLLQQLAALPETLKLNEIKDAADDARQVWVNNQGDIWKKTFVAHLGLIWLDLVKKPPRNSDPFKSFVADAWAALKGDPKESFDRTVLNVVPGFSTYR
jgi:hypothetical protein